MSDTGLPATPAEASDQPNRFTSDLVPADTGFATGEGLSTPVPLYVYGGPGFPAAAAPPRPTPTLGDLGVFVLILIATGILTGLAVVGTLIAIYGTKFKLDTLTDSQKFSIGVPIQAVWYLLALGAMLLLFSRKWERPFAAGIHWNSALAKQHWGKLLLTGVGLAMVAGLASMKLPMPKDAPIDELFKTPALAWMALVFGVFIAPPAEEMAFRGFLLPSLRGPVGAVVAAILTSVAFALMHSSQLAHAWGPLSVLFTVSLVLCYIRIKTASVACSALVHAGYNAFLFAGFLVATGGFRHLDKIKM